MYRLDRLKDSGRITKAFLPARDLYRSAPNQLDQPVQNQNTTEPNFPSENSGDNPTPPIPQLNPISRPTCPNPPSPVLGLHEQKPTRKPIRQRPIPPAPGQAATYKPNTLPQVFVPFIFHLQSEPEEDPPLEPQYDESQEPWDSSTDSVFDSAESGPSTPSNGTTNQDSSPKNNTGSTSPEQPPPPGPVLRQRSGTYPPPTGPTKHKEDASHKDPSRLCDLGSQQRPKRNTNPPHRLTYDKRFKQTIRKHHSKDTSSEEES